jgi:hypothetical protein
VVVRLFQSAFSDASAAVVVNAADPLFQFANGSGGDEFAFTSFAQLPGVPDLTYELLLHVKEEPFSV